jgi:hypothetical protein
MTKSGAGEEAAGYSLYCEIDGSPVTLLAEDLSTAGFFVQTTTPKPMDRELEILVRSSVGELIALGQVVQVVDSKRAKAENRRPGYGLLFTSLEDDQRAFIGLTLDALDRWQRARAKAEAAARLATRPADRPPTVPSIKPPATTTTPAERKQITADLRAELAKLQGKTAWTALGLEPDSPLHRAKEAFLHASKRFHPHKYARHNSAEITNLATEVFIAYKRSYSVLTKLAPRVSGTALQDRNRVPQRPATSIAPAAPASMRPAAPRPNGNRTRSR